MGGFRTPRMGQALSKKQQSRKRKAQLADGSVQGVDRSPSRLDSHVWRIGLLVLSLAMQCLVFPPLDIWPLAFVCLVPWFVCIAVGESAPTAYLFSYLLGAGFFLINLRWMGEVTPPGYVVFSLYLAVYYPLVACPVRYAVRRRRIPLAVIGPIVWVATELCRATVISGFPWFFLGHTAYKVLTLIQISDLVGAYGVSFVLVAINGALADLILRRCDNKGESPISSAWPTRLGTWFAGLLLVFTCVYGWFRLAQTEPKPGPKVAVLQQDYPNHVDEFERANEPRPFERRASYEVLLARASADEPDLFLLPETPWTMALNPEMLQSEPDEEVRFYRQSYDMLHTRATRSASYLVTGAMSRIETPYAVKHDLIQHNSAFVFPPDGSPPQRYDKVHCVYFGEVVPFRYGRLRFLYFWLNELTPYGANGYEFSITPGSEFRVFSMKPESMPGQTFRFGVPICYEDVMPYVSRRFVLDPVTKEKRVDFLLNISNDGWFVHSDELPQHLAICVFRAVENRVPIARAVNTGISGFIDSTGKIHDLVEVNGRSRGPGIVGHSTANLMIDDRLSVYTRTGDIFAVVCGLLSLLVYADYVIVRIIASRRPETG